MLDDTFGWSHARGNEVVPSPWQATALAQFLSWVAHDSSALGEIAQLSRADDEIEAVFLTGCGVERRVPWRWFPERSTSWKGR